jgi:hypothetical protein
MSAGEAVNPPRERWFLKLYPREWRARYGDELSAMVGDRPLSLGASFDLIAGAIDARFTKGTKMPAILKSACLTRNDAPTKAESLRGAAIMIVSSLALLGLATFAKREGWPETAEAVTGMSFPVSLVLMTHVMYLRKQSFAVKAVITGGTLTFLIGISILNAL